MAIRLFVVVVYISFYLFLVFVAVCLACGLYYLAELVEEFTTLTKKVIKGTIISVAVIHILLLLVDNLPLNATLVGLAAHAMYYQLLKSFPFISLKSPQFLGSLALLGADHWIWFRYFRRVYYRPYHVLGFFLLVVWLVPFGFFISLSINENVLPMDGAPAPRGLMEGGESSKRPRSFNGLLSLFNYIKRKKQDILPSSLPARYGKSAHIS
eukprot:CAMPEP_0184650496 /NCGR_PEP_ID=MMETSP0308-20130426/8021_1 /TAXON_ID=38269 /ORGANISM="Gloeochaete witrockiana, Strain SAG 46.84" /LENGTH=210 /DNA_ID=CAMNT_0027084045 /DNA_START=54 /DNA_END=686 /DNA_ORIENTATION=-